MIKKLVRSVPIALLFAALAPGAANAVALYDQMTYAGELTGNNGLFTPLSIDVMFDNRPRYQGQIGRLRYEIRLDGRIEGLASSTFDEDERVVGIQGDVTAFFPNDPRPEFRDSGAANLLGAVRGPAENTVRFTSTINRVYNFQQKLLPDQWVESTLLNFRIIADEIDGQHLDVLSGTYDYRVAIDTFIDFQRVFQVPAPAVLGLFGLGVAALAFARRRGAATA